MKYLVSGGTGLIGKKLVLSLHKSGNEVTVIARNKEKAEKLFPFAKVFYWEYGKKIEIKNAFEGQDVVIHLSGENVFGKRWSDEYKKQILESRVKSTSEIASIIASLNYQPKYFINASAIGIYGNRKDEILTEHSKVGNDFLALVCKQWENAANIVTGEKTKKIILRIGNVLSAEGGMLEKTLLPYKFFAGGSLGSGSQYVSWIHEDDLIRIFDFVVTNGITGTINCTSPGNETMDEYSRLLGKTLRRPAFFKVPQFLLNLVVGEGAKYITSSQRVQPFVLLKNGFRFTFTSLENALEDLLKT